MSYRIKLGTFGATDLEENVATQRVNYACATNVLSECVDQPRIREKFTSAEQHFCDH